MKINRLKLLYKNFDNELSKNYKNTNSFSDKALNISIQIVEEIDSIFDWRKNSDKKTEDHKIETISRLQSLYQVKWLNVLDVDDLLVKIIEKIENILSFNVIKLWYDIFPASNNANIIETWNENNEFERKKQTVDKFW